MICLWAQWLFSSVWSSLLLRPQLCCIEASYETVIGSAAGGFVTRGLGGHGSCLIPELMALPPVPSSVGWYWDKCPLQDPQLGPRQWAYYQLCSGCGSFQVPKRTAVLLLMAHWWTRQVLIYGWEGLEQSSMFLKI